MESSSEAAAHSLKFRAWELSVRDVEFRASGGSLPKLLFPKWGNSYRAPYYHGNPNIGPRIIGNLDQSPG